MDRMSDRDNWFLIGNFKTMEHNGEFDVKWAKINFDIDCREKGVKLISYKHDDKGVEALVEWLASNTGKRK